MVGAQAHFKNSHYAASPTKQFHRLAAYLANFDLNVMTVDWSPLARPPNYADAVQGAITAGNVLSRLLHHFVHDCKLIESKDVQIAGKSLRGSCDFVISSCAFFDSCTHNLMHYYR